MYRQIHTHRMFSPPLVGQGIAGEGKLQTMIAQKLGIPEWSAITFSTRHRNLADIDLSDIEFHSKTGEGVIIVNWGTILEGKLVILLAGSPTFQQALAVEIASRL